MENLTAPLSPLEGARWLLVPASVQWIILQETRFRSLRLALLAPVCLMLYAFARALLVITACAFLVLALAALLFQMDFLTVIASALEFAGMILFTQEAFSALGRIALFAVGWGLGWVVYTYTKPVGGQEDA